jgi:hypothetical protein
MTLGGRMFYFTSSVTIRRSDQDVQITWYVARLIFFIDVRWKRKTGKRREGDKVTKGIKKRKKCG